nr:hypothetical protein [Persicimonas caeni]
MQRVDGLVLVDNDVPDAVGQKLLGVQPDGVVGVVERLHRVVLDARVIEVAALGESR